MKPALVIVGLGNPGVTHELTRHNAGFWAIDELAKSFGEGKWADRPKFLAKTCEARILTVPILLVKPQTFMNRSGECVKKLVDFFRLDTTEQMLVITDDIDLPLGELRFRANGGPGTHNGMRSIVQSIGEGFPRMRIGLGKPTHDEDLANWVLNRPSEEERKTIDIAISELPKRVQTYVLERPEPSV